MNRLPQRSAIRRGFTLIEVMITVAIVAILAAVAYPGYRDYIIRSKLVNATNGLTTMRAEMERYFQDNRTYSSVGTFVAPCLSTAPAGPRTFGDPPDNFVITCTIVTGTATVQPAFTLTAAGNGAMSTFSFTVTNLDVRRTISTATGWTAASTANCWVVRKGQVCS